jgi:hypothetical protein
MYNQIKKYFVGTGFSKLKGSIQSIGVDLASRTLAKEGSRPYIQSALQFIHMPLLSMYLFKHHYTL